MKNNKKMLKTLALGFLTGAVNGLFGAGGGMIAVPMLRSFGLKQKNAHATSIAIIMPLCAVSGVIYYFSHDIDFLLTLKLIPFGLIGCVAGTAIMKKISPKWLKRLFSLFLIYAGVRMIMKG